MKEKAENKSLMPSTLLSWLKIEKRREGIERIGVDRKDVGGGGND